MAVADRTRSLVLLLALTALAACDAPPPQESAEEPPAEAAVAMEPAPDAGSAPVDATPTAAWSDRRAMAEVDAAFPHSEHRDVDCERCHVRPSSHVTHTDASCTACHGRPAGFDGLPRRPAIECAGCHHEDNADRSCTSCHDRDREGPRPVLTTVRTAGGEEARVRRVVFSHALHADRSCTGCHTEAVTRSFGGECSACHESHHTARADCRGCHEAEGLAVHESSNVHAGCAGSGCHEDAVVMALEPNRNVCLTCHTGQVDHKVGRECGECHVGMMSSLAGARGGRR